MRLTTVPAPRSRRPSTRRCDNQVLQVPCALSGWSFTVATLTARLTCTTALCRPRTPRQRQPNISHRELESRNSAAPNCVVPDGGGMPCSHMVRLGVNVPSHQVGAGQLSTFLPDGESIRRRGRSAGYRRSASWLAVAGSPGVDQRGRAGLPAAGDRIRIHGDRGVERQFRPGRSLQRGRADAARTRRMAVWRPASTETR